MAEPMQPTRVACEHAGGLWMCDRCASRWGDAEIARLREHVARVESERDEAIATRATALDRACAEEQRRRNALKGWDSMREDRDVALATLATVKDRLASCEAALEGAFARAERADADAAALRQMLGEARSYIAVNAPNDYAPNLLALIDATLDGRMAVAQAKAAELAGGAMAEWQITSRDSYRARWTDRGSLNVKGLAGRWMWNVERCGFADSVEEAKTAAERAAGVRHG